MSKKFPCNCFRECCVICETMAVDPSAPNYSALDISNQSNNPLLTTLNDQRAVKFESRDPSTYQAGYPEMIHASNNSENHCIAPVECNFRLMQNSTLEKCRSPSILNSVIDIVSNSVKAQWKKCLVEYKCSDNILLISYSDMKVDRLKVLLFFQVNPSRLLSSMLSLIQKASTAIHTHL